MRPLLSCLLLSCLLLPGCGGSDEPSAPEQAIEAAVEGLDRARNERTMNQLETLRTAMERYSIDNGGTYPEGSSLASVSASLSPAYLPLLKAEDAWGNTMTYSSDGRGYSIVSAGPDGVIGTADDIALRDGAITGGR